MTRPRAWLLGALLTCLLLGLVLLDSVLPARVGWWWPSAPVLLLPPVIGAGWLAGVRLGAYAGFGAGLLVDLVPPAAGPLGSWAFVLAGSGWLGAHLVRNERRLTPVVLVTSGAVALAPVASAVLAVALGLDRVDLPGALGALGPTWVAGVLAAALVLPVMRAAVRPTGPRPLEVDPAMPVLLVAAHASAA